MPHQIDKLQGNAWPTCQQHHVTPSHRSPNLTNTTIHPFSSYRSSSPAPSPHPYSIPLHRFFKTQCNMIM